MVEVKVSLMDTQIAKDLCEILRQVVFDERIPEDVRAEYIQSANSVLTPKG